MFSFRWARVMAALALCASCGATHAQGVYQASGAWLDDQGRPFRWEVLRGGFTVVNMAYGACRRVCSTSLRRMEELQRLADVRRVALSFVVVGIDPSLDRPIDWAAYRVDRKLNRSNWQFLTGDAMATRRLAARLGVRYWHYGDHVMHDFRIALLAPDGRLVATLNAPDDDLGQLIP